MNEQPAPDDPPVGLGEACRVKISDVAFGGDGVGRVSGFAVFVPFVLPGEDVLAEITQVRKRYARAIPRDIMDASPDRVTPVCAYYGTCGGCQYQHASYKAEIEIKYRQVSDLLRRIGRQPDAPIQSVVPCPNPYRYRNRLSLHTQWNAENGTWRIGFVGLDNRTVIDVAECPLADTALNDHLRALRARPPDPMPPRIEIRLSPEGWDVPFGAFFQSNERLLPKLVDAVVNVLREGKSQRLIDLFCGVGLFGILAADIFPSVIGIDIDSAAIAAARRNAQRRELKHVKFAAGHVGRRLREIFDRDSSVETAVVLDPPRTGCPADILDLLLDAAPREIVYVSCDPATLARDLRRLCAPGGYTLRSLQPIDMFPRTRHLECVAGLLRNPGGDPASPPADGP